MARTTLKIDISGPFFRRDPRKSLRSNIRRILDELGDAGERTVEGATPVLTGALAHGIRRTRVRERKPDLFSVTIFASHIYPWPGNPSGTYKGGKVERQVGMFRRTKNALMRHRKVLAADLTEGLN